MNLDRHHLTRRLGFSFTEVLFAVVILGIGFIMVAAIFPVAIQQSKLTIDETTGAALARGAASYFERAMTDRDVTGKVVGGAYPSATSTNVPPAQEGTGNYPVVQQLGFTAAATHDAEYLWTAIRGNLILPEDPRYGFVSLYRRAGTLVGTDASPFAQVYVFAVQANTKTVFSPNEDVKALTLSSNGTAIGAETNLMAHAIKVAIRHNDIALGGGDFIAFDTSTGLTPLQIFNAAGTNGTGAPVEGGYVIIASDNLAAANNKGRMDGRIFKVGARRPDLDSTIATPDDPFPSTKFSALKTGIVFEIDPSSPFEPEPGVDGISRRFYTGQASTDDIAGLGNSASLDLFVPNSSSDPTPVAVATTPVSTGTANAFVVGRSFTEPADADPSTQGYSGGNMAVGVYTTFVRVK